LTARQPNDRVFPAEGELHRQRHSESAVDELKRWPERRHLTVMFCDLVGSTALASRLDPEDLREVIGAYHRCIAEAVARFNGFVAKYLGDGVLVYFGYPQAHEDDAERAVRSGLEIVAAVERLAPREGIALQARIGIATGLAVVGDLIGEGAAREEAVVGETPNLAARLQSLAEPGQVIISRSARQLLGGMFELAALGSHVLKGFAEPVPTWRVLRPSAVESRFEAFHEGNLAPLVGRDGELALLLNRFERAKNGKGQVVMLCGEPGIGKSRLLCALHERLGDEPHTPLWHFCSPLHQNSALHPLIGLIERAAGLRRADSLGERLDKLEAYFVLTAENVQRVTPLVADLLGVATGSRYAPANLTPQEKKERTLEALVDQLAGLAARQPVLALYEDVHWADPTTIDLLGRVVNRIPQLPILAVMTLRRGFVPPWVGHACVTMLTLTRLTRQQAAVVIRQAAGGKVLPVEVDEQILAKTDGVPLFVEELTKTVLESGLLEEGVDGFALTGPLPPLAIPATLQDSLMARLDRLGAAKEIAQTGAVIGREFAYELLAAVAPLGEHALREALARLVAAELVFPRGVPPYATYTFKHALVRDAAYASLLKSRRHELHVRVASALQERFPEIVANQPEVLARHFTQAGLVPQAIAYWRRAGERANEHSASMEAIADLEEGLRLVANLPDPKQRLEEEFALRMAISGPLTATKGYAAPEVECAYLRARELSEQLGRSSELFAVLRGLWNCQYSRGELLTGHDLARHLVALARKQGEPLRDALAHRALGSTLFFLGRFAEAREKLEQCIAFDEAGTASGNRRAAILLYADSPGVVARLHLACLQWLLGFPDRALETLETGLSLGEELAHAHHLALALTFAAIVRYWRREFGAALRHAEAALKVARQHALAGRLAIGTICRGAALARLGRHEEGVAQLHAGFAAWHETGARLYDPMWLAFTAEGHAATGRFDAAFAALNRATETASATAQLFCLPELHRLRGAFCLATGESAQAQHWLAEAVNLARRQRAKSFELRAATSLAQLWRDQGRCAEAREVLQPAYNGFTEGFDTADLKDASALLDTLSRC
jgi:class 3 adenylate cyclase/predicted ATPase